MGGRLVRTSVAAGSRDEGAASMDGLCPWSSGWRRWIAASRRGSLAVMSAGQRGARCASGWIACEGKEKEEEEEEEKKEEKEDLRGCNQSEAAASRCKAGPEPVRGGEGGIAYGRSGQQAGVTGAASTSGCRLALGRRPCYMQLHSIPSGGPPSPHKSKIHGNPHAPSAYAALLRPPTTLRVVGVEHPLLPNAAVGARRTGNQCKTEGNHGHRFYLRAISSTFNIKMSPG
ncbi:hypothetical protein BDZ91DRAFT_763199 [Kalaharituber pfeilii]|nr:hypothetical protein BDZ91DRAFT_763199 [Kalaharituber pfeilii]